jgi:hypothetical protein
MAAILSRLGLYGGNRKSKIPLLANWGYMSLEGEIGNLCHRCIGRVLDASLAISTRVLCFEDSRLRRRTLVRPVLLTGRTGTHRSDQSDPPVRPVWSCCISVFGSSILALWINQGTKYFSGEPPETPRTHCSLCQSPLMTWLPRSPGSTFEAQPRNCP